MGKHGGGPTSRPARQVQQQPNVTRVASEAAVMLTGMFGREVTESELRGMVGATQGARLSVRTDHDYTEEGKVPAVRFDLFGPTVPVQRYVDAGGGKLKMGTVQEPLYAADNMHPADRFLYRAPDGRLEMHNATFRVLPEYQGKGVGLEVFAKQVKTLSSMGVARIGASMAGWRRSSDQGYFVWPLFGYNTRPGQLEGEYKFALRDKTLSRQDRSTLKRLGKNSTLLDWYAHPALRNWWREHGAATSGQFDLRPGSRSMDQLQAYLSTKGIKWEDV
jgi:GNAT superfamily N-acetyltransferase